jgi:hypothetical protein
VCILKGDKLVLADFDLWNFLGGVVAGGMGGALLTLKISKKSQHSSGSGNTVNQSGAKAGGDVVGRDKRS